MDILPINVEVVNQSNLDEAELAEFVVTEPMQVDADSKFIKTDDDGELIKHFMDGKLSFSDYKCQVLDQDESGEDEEDEYQDDEIYMDEEEVQIRTEKRPIRPPSPNSSRNFDKEMDQGRRNNLRGQFSNRSKRKKSYLPAALQGLMGEANLRYARGDNETAKKICLEIIRQVPTAVEPFHTLAQIYEGVDQEKCMQFMFIAGHLNPSDVDHWIRLAEMSEEAKNLKQAVVCYSKAIASAKNDIALRLRRIELLRQLGDEKTALHSELIMVRYIEDPVFQLEKVRELAKKFHEMKAPERALIAFRGAHKTNGDHFSVVDLNQYLELLIDAKLYGDALNILCQHTKIDLQVTARTDDEEHSINGVTFPADLIPDFRSKAMICLIYLKDTSHLFDYMVDDALRTMNVETDGDCLLDIAEALMAEEEYDKALRLLQPLVDSEKFALAAVFLRYGDCLRLLGQTDLAIDSYRQVVQMAPQHLDARLTLSALLKQKNQPAEALKALEQDLESDMVEPTLLYEHCYMLKETGNVEQYIDLSGVLFSRHCFRFRSREEVEISINNRRIYESWNSLKEYREFRLEDCEDTEGPEFVKSVEEPNKEREWELFEDVVKQCYKTGRFATMQLYTHAAMTSRRFEKHRAEIQFLALIACIANRDYSFAGFHAKELLLRNPGSARAWNLYMATNHCATHLNKLYHRFLQRFVQKEADSVEQGALDWKASYCLGAGTYHTAVRHYSTMFKETKAPFAALLTAIALSHLSVQKFTYHKSDHINQSIVFLNEYAKCREPEAQQEIYYNSGRLYQQLGLNAQAAECYKRVLGCETHPDREMAEITDLKREAAFNLHLLYKSSGNMTLARKYLYDYVVI